MTNETTNHPTTSGQFGDKAGVDPSAPQTTGPGESRHDRLVVDLENEASLRAALASHGDDPVLLGNLGRLLRQQGDPRGAIAAYRRASEQAGAPAAIWFNLGLALYDEGETEPALAAVDQALNLAADLHLARLLRARCLVQLQRLEEAGETYQALLQAEPRNFNAWLELGNVFRRLGRDRQALDSYDRAVCSRPDDTRGYLAGARAMEAMGAMDEAARYYHLAVTRCGDQPMELARIYHTIGRFRLDDGQPARALESLRQALLVARWGGTEMEPDQVAEIHIDLGEVLIRLDLEEEGLCCFERASAATDEKVLVRLAETAYRFNQCEAGEAVLRRNIELHPDSVVALTNLAHLLIETNQLASARTVLDQAEAMSDQPRPEVAAMRSSIASKSGDVSQALELSKERLEGLSGKPVRSSAAMLSLYSDAMTPTEVAALHRRLMAPYGEGARPRASFANRRDPNRVLRVGLVSADFHHQHPVNIFMQPVLARWDHAPMVLHGYNVGVSPDDQTRLAKSRCDHWREMTHATREQMARRIEADAIDILIDLGGHTGHQRIEMFCQRMAPVQVSFLGYPGSTGAPNMDWILGDPVVTPPENDHLCSERVWRLPHTVFCFAPEQDYPMPELGDERINRPLTFASFNNIPKLTPHTVDLWAAVLQAVPGSRLLLKSGSFGDSLVNERYSQQFANRGIGPDRLLFRGPTPLAMMMQEYGLEVDIALDPQPYNGGTTTLQALWMGVPVVVKEGGHFVSRMGASFMRAAGLDDWVARDDGQYVAIARQMAEDRHALLALKRGLRSRQLARPAWDADRYTRDFQRALRAMWVDWCTTAGQSRPPGL